MSSLLRCEYCGRLLMVPGEPGDVSAVCPHCGKEVKATGDSSPSASRAYEQFASANQGSEASAVERSPKTSAASLKNLTWQRMFQALLDPNSIQWILMIGGGLCVLGL